MLTRTFLLCFCLGAFVAICASQDSKKNSPKQHPDFSGTWIIAGQSGKKAQSKQIASEKSRLVIVHREPELRITRIIVTNGQEHIWESVYYTDGRGEKNSMNVQVDPYSTEMRDEAIGSKAVWKSDKMVIRSKIGKAMGTRFENIELVYEWKLSADGQTLTETTRFTNNGMPVNQPAASDLTIPGPSPRQTSRVYRRAS